MNLVRTLAAIAVSGLAFQAEAYTENCKTTDEREIASLFDGWNAALATGNPTEVAARYADDSILLPTLSNTPRLTQATRRDYFVQFLRSKPRGTIDTRLIQIGCNSAVDAGTYTFTFSDGKRVAARYTYTYRWNGSRWLISSHHSSAMPEAIQE